MLLISPWNDTESMYWLPALSLPTQAWAKPFIPLLGLPRELLEQPEVWHSIYAWAAEEHETRWEALDWAVGQEGGPGGLVREVVLQALEKLAEQTSKDVAINLGGWVLFHFFCSEASAAMREWEAVLRLAYMGEYSRRGRRVKVPPPQALESLLPDIYQDINFPRRQEIQQQIKRLAPPPPKELIPYERLDNCYEATLLSKAVDQGMTLSVLQYIAGKLELCQRQEVVNWAQQQFCKMDSRYGPMYAKDLCGDKYLRPELPWAHLPSVFDIPAQGEVDWEDSSTWI